MVLTREGLRERLPETGARVVALERPSDAGRTPAPAPGDGSRFGLEDALAYVIFTSGSTGRPQGHRGHPRLADQLHRLVPATPTPRGRTTAPP